jgi:hypothetical protein
MTLRFTIGGERPHRVVEPHQTESLGPLHEAPSTTDNPCDRAARHAFRLVAFGPTSSVAAGNLMLVSNAARVARCRRTSSNNGCGRGWRVEPTTSGGASRNGRSALFQRDGCSMVGLDDESSANIATTLARCIRP